MIDQQIIDQWDNLQFPKVQMDQSFTWTGFDSAWTGKKPGAIAWMIGNQSGLFFKEAKPAGFRDCLDHVDKITSNMHLLMIDQPTIVQNTTGRRPVEMAIAHTIGSAAGGVQPANLNKTSMFGVKAPIWSFLEELKSKNFQESSTLSVKAKEGRYYLETFPALGNLGMFGYECCPKYNPARNTFVPQHWNNLCAAIGRSGEVLGINGLQRWINVIKDLKYPTKGIHKGIQDQVDAILCMLFGYIWWRSGFRHSTLIGDNKTGYMTIPCFRQELREKLKGDAKIHDVRIDTHFCITSENNLKKESLAILTI